MHYTVITLDALCDILAAHAYDEFAEEDDAQHCAVHAGKCGSPFRYEVVKLRDLHFVVVPHIEAPLYRSLIAAVQA
jgi:hypothetical protein